MQSPTWLQPGVTGAIVGAIVTMAFGFTQGGWHLRSSAERLAEQHATAAVTAALLPVCVDQAKADPDSLAKLAQLGAITSPYERREFVMKTGWATMPAAELPNRDLATACAQVLLDTKQS